MGDDLFADNPMTKPFGDGETHVDQAKSVGDEVRALKRDLMIEKKDGEEPGP